MVKAPLPAKKAAFSAVCCALTLCLLTALARPDPLRLHVLANSDSPRDQAVKLEVRDAVHLYQTIEKLRKVPHVIEVARGSSDDE